MGRSDGSVAERPRERPKPPDENARPDERPPDPSLPRADRFFVCSFSEFSAGDFAHHAYAEAYSVGNVCSRRRMALVATRNPFLVSRQRRDRGTFATSPYTCRRWSSRETLAERCAAVLALFPRREGDVSFSRTSRLVKPRI